MSVDKSFYYNIKVPTYLSKNWDIEHIYKKKNKDTVKLNIDKIKT